MYEVSPKDVPANAQLIDVREDDEYAVDHARGVSTFRWAIFLRATRKLTPTKMSMSSARPVAAHAGLRLSRKRLGLGQDHQRCRRHRCLARARLADGHSEQDPVAIPAAGFLEDSGFWGFGEYTPKPQVETFFKLVDSLNYLDN